MHWSNVCNYYVVVTIAAHLLLIAQHGIKTWVYFPPFFIPEWFPLCDFTIIYKRKLADSHNFRFSYCMPFRFTSCQTVACIGMINHFHDFYLNLILEWRQCQCTRKKLLSKLTFWTMYPNWRFFEIFWFFSEWCQCLAHGLYELPHRFSGRDCPLGWPFDRGWWSGSWGNWHRWTHSSAFLLPQWSHRGCQSSGMMQHNTTRGHSITTWTRWGGEGVKKCLFLSTLRV